MDRAPIPPGNVSEGIDHARHRNRGIRASTTTPRREGDSICSSPLVRSSGAMMPLIPGVALAVQLALCRNGGTALRQSGDVLFGDVGATMKTADGSGDLKPSLGEKGGNGISVSWTEGGRSSTAKANDHGRLISCFRYSFSLNAAYRSGSSNSGSSEALTRSTTTGSSGWPSSDSSCLS